MLTYQARMLEEEAKEKGIECRVLKQDETCFIELGPSHHRWLSYWYAVMDLWELEYKKEGVRL